VVLLPFRIRKVFLKIRECRGGSGWAWCGSVRLLRARWRTRSSCLRTSRAKSKRALARRRPVQFFPRFFLRPRYAASSSSFLRRTLRCAETSFLRTCVRSEPTGRWPNRQRSNFSDPSFDFGPTRFRRGTISRRASFGFVSDFRISLEI
jgi:hypothetical protein